MPALLRLAPAELRAIQDARLRHMLALCRTRHPHYREAWRGIDLDTIQGVADLPSLPLTEKAALMAAPDRFRLDATGLPVEERALWEVLHTTGSTGDPTPIYNTTHDWRGYMVLSRRTAEIVGVTDRDLVANLLPLTAAAMGAYMRASPFAFAAGAAMVAALPGAPIGRYDVQQPLDSAVRLIERHRATVLLGVTSFIRRVLLRALELGADVTAVRLLAITGEASTPALRDDLRGLLRRLGVAGTTVFDRYGSTETGGLAQCQEEADWHNPAPDMLYYEAVDPLTGASLPDGTRGHLAITHLDRRGTVLIRYLLGDIGAIDRSPCPHCGRTAERILGPLQRASPLLKVKGMLVNPALLLARLQEVPGVAEFQAVVQRPDGPLGMDELLVRLALHHGAPAEATAAAVIATTQAAIGLRPRVQIEATPRAIYDPEREAKATRFLDRRPASA